MLHGLFHPDGAHEAAASLTAHPEPSALALPAWLSRWTFDPLVLAALLLVGGAYAVGIWRLWQRAGRCHALRPRHLACMAAGWLSLVLSLLSPLDALSDVSFAAHMTQHQVLMVVAAPLLVLGRPLVVLLWSLPAPARRRVGQVTSHPAFAGAWRWLSGPVITLMVHSLVVWMWHVPSWFDAALAHEPLHAVQHLSFFLTAALFWWAVVHGRYGRVGYGVSVLFVFATALHQSVLGALLTLARAAWYPLAAERARGAGLDPLGDQQLAGLLMWVPSGVLFSVLGLALFSAWIGDIEHRARRGSEAN
jgi:putative membrane protein